MKLFPVILLLVLTHFSNTLNAQQSHERYASKTALTRLQWPSLNTRNETCGLQFINQSTQLNLVIYPSAFQWGDQPQRQAFLDQYLDETNHKSAHFDGTVTIIGERNLAITGSRTISCQGNWTWKGNTRPGTLSGTLEVISPDEIRIILNGSFMLDQFGINPQDRSVLDLPDNTQVQISGTLPGM